MEALLCRNVGDPTKSPDSAENSALTHAKSHPIPELNSPTTVRVGVKAFSLNFANLLQIQGEYEDMHPFPFIPGSDFSGIVESVGPQVTSFKVGDHVCGFVAVGAFAQFVVADEADLFLVPNGCDLVTAGALPVAYGTSHLALVERAHLSSGQVLLVLGAAGGVGIAAVQIGKVCGAVVIAVASGDEKVRLLNSMGVDHVVDLSQHNIIGSVEGFLNKRNLRGVDVLYDPVGGEATKESMELLNWAAHILVIGFASGEVPVIPANIALFKNWTIHGVSWGSQKVDRPGVREDSLKELLSWLSKGLITINVSHTFSLSQANLGFAAIRDRKAMGKVMIVFDDLNILHSQPQHSHNIQFA